MLIKQPSAATLTHRELEIALCAIPNATNLADIDTAIAAEESADAPRNAVLTALRKRRALLITAAPPVKPAKGKDPAQIAVDLVVCHSKAAADALRKSCAEALQAGLPLLWLHKQTVSSTGHAKYSTGTGFKTAVEKSGISEATAYRWANAAAAVLAREQKLDTAEDLDLPVPGSAAWTAAEKILAKAAAGMSLRRLMLGSPGAGEINRLDDLVSRTEHGDPHAAEVLDAVEAGRLTLVQAIRAAAGAAATRGKTRRDPVYLDIDGKTGEPVGLFISSLITINRAFAIWPDLPEPARRKVRETWKEIISHIPPELR